MAADAMSDYPVTFDVAYPESPNRWLILIRWLLAIPHYIVLAILAAALAAVEVIVLFTILLAKTFPDRLYRFTVGVNRWALNVGAYVLFLDRYPPFSMNEGAYPGVTFTVERPEDLNRWSVLVRWLLVTPHAIVLAALGAIAAVVLIPFAIAVLVTGRYPRGLFDFYVGVGRWKARANAYLTHVADRYPPFALK